MFSAWGAFVYRHRRAVALVSVVLALISFPLAGQASSVLSSGGWLVSGSESANVGDRIAQEFDGGRSSLIILMRTGDGSRADSAATQDKVEASVSGLRADDRVGDVITYRSAGNDARFISNDGSATYALVLLQATDEESIDQVDGLRAEIQQQPELTYQLTGYGPLAGDANEQSEEDLQKAEIVSLPLALVILLFRIWLRSGRRIAAAGGRAGDPHNGRHDLPRRPADRNEHLRDQRRDDARACPGDRLLALPCQSIPRGAASRSRGG